MREFIFVLYHSGLSSRYKSTSVHLIGLKLHTNVRYREWENKAKEELSYPVMMQKYRQNKEAKKGKGKTCP